MSDRKRERWLGPVMSPQTAFESGDIMTIAHVLKAHADMSCVFLWEGRRWLLLSEWNQVYLAFGTGRSLENIMSEEELTFLDAEKPSLGETVVSPNLPLVISVVAGGRERRLNRRSLQKSIRTLRLAGAIGSLHLLITMRSPNLLSALSDALRQPIEEGQASLVVRVAVEHSEWPHAQSYGLNILPTPMVDLVNEEDQEVPPAQEVNELQVEVAQEPEPPAQEINVDLPPAQEVNVEVAQPEPLARLLCSALR